MPRQHSLTSPLLIWLTPQLLSLLLSAMRVPLSAHPPRPMESVALQQMLIVQIVVAAMFAPILFRSFAAVIAVILTAAPMLQLAAFLSSVPLAKTTALYQLGASWGLAVGGSCLATRGRHKLLVSTVATTWALGGLVIAYINTEFAPQRHVPHALLGPAYVAIDAASAEKPSATIWVFVGTLATLGLATACAHRLRRAPAPTT